LTRALYVLLGDPVAHSRSPKIHARAFQLLGIDAVYAPCRVTDVPAAFAGLRALGAAGFNVTVPHKEAAARLCAKLDGAAARIGAVNCVDAAFTGHNTDVAGLLRSLENFPGEQRSPALSKEVNDVYRDPAVVLGAGGSARAAAFAFPGCAIVNRTIARAEVLARELGAHVASVEALREARLVVNCTTVGLADDSLPLEVSALRSDATVVDLVYRGQSGETALVKAARARGLRAVDGLAVLVHQAIASLEIWLGRKDLAELYAPLREAALA
jgi:shikimate dehydrogenase